MTERSTTPRRMSDDALPKIGAPATRALAQIGVTNLSQLVLYTTDQLLALHGLGPRAIRLLQDALQAHGLSFAGSDAANGREASER